ncbi:VanZ family protein [Nitrogeniibacter mangrovi]|uniref:VanZ family protein n=1 Tax=Nitrogeniibacter mangrovi TaxID=2016596 RepID=A0A6C1AYV1_9RHOO|nr:VanZ family protein [Nitrogeniibacter mangrovi]QID16532.1 VanZ family protein [Nitrogeniibacter mangrovi]
MRAATQLPRYLALAYALLIAYACLHPFTGWQPTGLPWFDYLTAPWPRYYRGLDIVLNVLGFLPFGFVLAAACPVRWPRPAAVLLTFVVSTVLSLSLETLQTLLPSRVASNVDLGANALGALIGAGFGATWGRRLFATGGWLHQWHEHRLIGGHLGDLGVVLIGLWLLAQLSPETLLFGQGDIRRLFDMPAPLPFSPERFMRLEAAIVATNVLAIGLITRSMLQRFSLTVPVVVLLGLGARTLAGASFYVPGRPWLWLTPGATAGLAAGAALLVLAMLLPRVLRHTLAAVALLAGTVLVNVAPENPYLLFNQTLISEGHFLNFNGLTQLVASAWPFLALAYLSTLNLLRSGAR